MRFEELVAGCTFSVSQREHHLLVFCSSFIQTLRRECSEI